MDVWKFIKPDKKVMSAFSIMFLLSVIGSFFILGHPGYLYQTMKCSSTHIYASGVGLPFGWAILRFKHVMQCIEGMCMLPACIDEIILFNPINFILDMIIFYVVALLVVRAYDKLKRKPERKKRK